MSVATFLPEPRVPSPRGAHPDADWLDALLPGAGDPVREHRAIYRETLRAVAEVEAGRPGGEAWKDAADKDARAALENKTPKTWALGALLAGDAQRWAKASAMARTLTRRLPDVPAAVASMPGIRSAAETRLEAERQTLADQAAYAWTLASTGRQDRRAQAWAALEAAHAARDEASRLAALLHWMAGDQSTRRGSTGFDPTAWRGDIWSPETRGHLMAAEDVLTDSRGKRLVVPQDVVWPEGHDLGRTIATPSGYRAGVAQERRTGILLPVAKDLG